MSGVTRKIYRVDPVVQLFARETSSDFKKLNARYKRLIKGKRFQAAFPRYGDIELNPGKGGGSYAHFYGYHGAKTSRGWMITLGGNRSEAVLLHEVAHMVARKHAEFGYCNDHGPGFASAYLAVVRVAQGRDAERALKHLYRALGIRLFKAGSKRGVLPRVKGEAPEAARDEIEKILNRKNAAAQERAYGREAVRRTDGTIGEHEVACPVCDETAKVQIHSLSRLRSTRMTYYVECDSCQLSEYQEVHYDLFARTVAAR